MVEATTKEQAADLLLRAAYETRRLDFYDLSTGFGGEEAERLTAARDGAAILVGSRMARYCSEDRSQIRLTNAGRFWALKGGYLAFLKDEPEERQEPGAVPATPDEYAEMKARYIRLRLNTFWWSFILSVLGFITSVVSLVIVVMFTHGVFN